MCGDGRVGWLVHGGHAGAVKVARVALDVHVEGDGTHRRLEVEQVGGGNTQPLTQIPARKVGENLFFFFFFPPL